jgi:hypothetical protein
MAPMGNAFATLERIDIFLKWTLKTHCQNDIGQY